MSRYARTSLLLLKDRHSVASDVLSHARGDRYRACFAISGTKIITQVLGVKPPAVVWKTI
jgi:hypothetical protein